MTKVVAGVVAVAILLGAYAMWYTHHRNEIIADRDRCDGALTRPEASPSMRAPDGTLVPVMAPCLMQPVPPSITDLVRGRIVLTRIPEGMKVNPYSFSDVLLGRYMLTPNIGAPCNQSATTTDCSRLPAVVLPSLPVPSNQALPADEWTTATGTPVSLAGFTFELPAGWHGKAYEDGFAGGWHAFVQKGLGEPGFTIDCPPNGKGLEVATRLSAENRSFAIGSTTYSVALEQWTAPGNDPWFFVWIRASVPGDWMTDASGTACLAQGGTGADVAGAIRALYETWNRPTELIMR